MQVSLKRVPRLTPRERRLLHRAHKPRRRRFIAARKRTPGKRWHQVAHKHVQNPLISDTPPAIVVG